MYALVPMLQLLHVTLMSTTGNLVSSQNNKNATRGGKFNLIDVIFCCLILYFLCIQSGGHCQFAQKTKDNQHADLYDYPIYITLTSYILVTGLYILVTELCVPFVIFIILNSKCI